VKFRMTVRCAHSGAVFLRTNRSFGFSPGAYQPDQPEAGYLVLFAFPFSGFGSPQRSVEH
jgi:hypothetical protein